MSSQAASTIIDVTSTLEMLTTIAEATDPPAKLQLITFTGQPRFVVDVYIGVGSLAFVINFFIFVVLLTERRRSSNLTELLMISQVSS